MLLYVAGVASLYAYPTHLARQTCAPPASAAPARPLIRAADVSENALLVGGASTSNAWTGINDYLTKTFRLDDQKARDFNAHINHIRN